MKRFYTILILIIFTSPIVQAQNSRTLGATSADSLDITHYHIYFNIPDISSQQITAHTIVDLTTRYNNLQSVRLDLLALNLDSIYVNATKISSYAYDDSTISINLPSPININDTISIDIFYHGSPVMDPSGWGGFYFSGSTYAYNLGVGFQDIPHNYGRVWFPCADNFTDRAFYDYYILCDTSMMAVCGGMLEGITSNGDSTHTVHWKMNQDIPTYLASMAVGEYEVVSDTIQLLNGKTPIDIWVRPSLVPNVSTSFPDLDTVLHIFEYYFGPYMWDRVGYIGVPFNSGAMEHATNIAYPNACINGTNSYQSLYAHELSHHWFGDLVTCSTAEDMWINEGWASYTEALVKQVLNGENAYKNEVRVMHAVSVRYAHIEDVGYYALNNLPQFNTYGTSAYDKGASIVHTLRYYMGDSLFFQGVKDFLLNKQYGSMSSQELRDELTSSSGINMSDFFTNWILTPGYPHFSIDSFSVVAGPIPEYQTRVYVKQKLRGRTTYGNNHLVEVCFMDENWNRWTDTMLVSGQNSYKDFLVPFEAEIVFCDIDEKICDATVDNYKVIKNTGYQSFDKTYCGITFNTVNDSALVRVTHNWVAPEKANVPSSNIYRIHESRYWNIEVLNEQNLNMDIKFNYNRSTSSSGYLDNDFLPTTNSKDSLILVWRKDNSQDWQMVNFYTIGSSSAGYIQTSNGQSGQYALAIGEPNQSGLNETNDSYFELFPNPTKDKVTIISSLKGNSELLITDLNGKTILSTQIKEGNTFYWDTSEQAKGMYEVILRNENICSTKKLIVY